jgi:hypothetical protein
MYYIIDKMRRCLREAMWHGEGHICFFEVL